MAIIDEKGHYYEPQARVTWSECYLDGKLIKYEWNGIVLYLPNKAEKKIVGRYGNNWKTPSNNKKFWVIEGTPKNKTL